MALPARDAPERASDRGATVMLAQSQESWEQRPAPGAANSRWPQHADVLPLAYSVLSSASLVAARYPAWRVAVFMLPALVDQLQRRVLRRQDAKTYANQDPDRLAWRLVSGRLLIVVAVFGALTATGAIDSPFLVMIVAPYVSALLIAGDRTATRALLVATGLAVCGLAALPKAWSGPELPRTLHVSLVVLSVIGVAAMLAPFHHASREVHQDLARVREEMASEALARARTLEQVATKVAHELKNPLCAVKALVQLALRDAGERPAQERLEIIETEIARMQQILSEYLSFSRPLQEARPEHVELGALVADTLLVLSARADQRRVRLTSHGQGAVHADPCRLKEVVLNLVANAIEATLPGGDVDVEVRAARDDAEIVVRDFGRGMTPETLSRVGTPFFTTREDGAGLGVVLARAAVVQHGGSLRFDSAPGKGTTATVKLPAHPARSSDGTRAARG